MTDPRSGVRYDPIVVSAESTVVAEYVSETADEAAYQSEAALEREFIGVLQAQAYEYLPLTSEAELIANLRGQLEALNGITFSEGEWERFFRESIAGADEGPVEKTLRIQEDHVQILRRDDGTTKDVAVTNKTKEQRSTHKVIRL